MLYNAVYCKRTIQEKQKKIMSGKILGVFTPKKGGTIIVYHKLETENNAPGICAYKLGDYAAPRIFELGADAANFFIRAYENGDECFIAENPCVYPILFQGLRKANDKYWGSIMIRMCKLSPGYDISQELESSESENDGESSESSDPQQDDAKHECRSAAEDLIAFLKKTADSMRVNR